MFRSAGMLLPVRKTWRSLFRFFVRYINREVLIGCRCWVISSSETSFGEKNEAECTGTAKIRKAGFLAAGETCIAIVWLAPVIEDKPFDSSDL